MNSSRKRNFAAINDDPDGDLARMVRQRPMLRSDATLLESFSPADQDAFRRVAVMLNQPVASLLANVTTSNPHTPRRNANNTEPSIEPQDMPMSTAFEENGEGPKSPHGSENNDEDIATEAADNIAFQAWTRNADDFVDPAFKRAVNEFGRPSAFIDQYQAADMTLSSAAVRTADDTIEDPVDLNGASMSLVNSVVMYGNAMPNANECQHPRSQFARPKQREIDTPQEWEKLAGPAILGLDWGTPTLADLDMFGTSDLDSHVAPTTTDQDAEDDGAFEIVEWKQWKPNEPANALRQQRRPFTDPKLRQETSVTRKLKACVRCRKQKIRCQTDEDNPSGECKTCRSVSTSHTKVIGGLVCLRYKLTECTIYRVGKGPGLAFTARWPQMKLKDITDWASPELRNIEILSDICPIPLKVTVRKFLPQPKDSMHRGWMDGKKKKWKRTEPYAIVNMAKARDDLKKYVDTYIYKCMDYFLEVNNCDALVKETYTFARKHMARTEVEDERVMMANFFRFWFAVRRTSTQEHIVGAETLGMKVEDKDKSYPLFGKIPLPPVLIQQLDMILTLGILNPLQKTVLDDFQKIVYANRPRSWMTVFLITFIALHNCGILTAKSQMNARRHGLRRRYSMPQFIVDLHHSANVFLSHYHYITKPCDPFKIDWKKRQSTRFAAYTPSEVRFLFTIRKMVEERRMRFTLNKELELCEDELYFVAQMFDEEWRPVDTSVDFNDGTINNEPLRIYYEDEMNLDDNDERRLSVS